MSQGANTGLSLPKVPPGPDTDKRLKALDTLYTDLNSAVRRAVTAAPALPAAQTARRPATSDQPFSSVRSASTIGFGRFMVS